MLAVYKGYVWDHGRLVATAEDIVAESYEQAASRAISALASRRNKDDAVAKIFSARHNGTPWPQDVTLQIVKEAVAHTCASVVYG